MAMFKELYKHLFKKRATVLYPFKERELVHIPEGYRGKISFYRDRCIGCGICATVCTSGACEMTTDEKGKRPIFYLDRCTFCSQCAESCPKNAIELTKDFEIIAFDRKTLVVK